jgi:cyclic-di-GMP-binding protein
MADNHSFDIVSEVNLQELDNSINQAMKEISHRYDLKDSNTDISFNQKENAITIESEDDFKLKSVREILYQKCIKREISPKSFVEKDPSSISGTRSKQQIELQQGISKEKGKDIVKFIKTMNIKVQSQIQDDQVRVTSKKIDDLQIVMKNLKTKEFNLPLRFINFR